ncbi:MAG: AAA family ATPase [Gammaproteobacteria bacterium]|nr:AAA family ATPase [Gammaproteobacteria bacterium]
MQDWWIYRGTGEAGENINKLPAPPPWRQFTDEAVTGRGTRFIPSDREIELVNAALYLRRPLLITGKPGVGKTSLAYAVAHELKLGSVLRWSITTKSKLLDGLYSYDAIARLQDASLRGNKSAEPPDISLYLRLGPLGTAFATRKRPRVLLIDEIDKSDIDLPNDLLHIFEEGSFEIPELARQPAQDHAILPYEGTRKITVRHGRMRCKAFPLVMMTSNGEREFPPAFLRRCLQLEMLAPDVKKLIQIVKSHLKLEAKHEQQVKRLLGEFLKRRDNEKRDLATDQLLNAIYLGLKDIDPLDRGKQELLNALWKSLSAMENV